MSTSPIGNSKDGVIHTQTSEGKSVFFHTDPAESQQFFATIQALSAGRDELREMLSLKTAWLDSVTAAGLPEEAALSFLKERLFS